MVDTKMAGMMTDHRIGKGGPSEKYEDTTLTMVALDHINDLWLRTRRE